MVMAWITNSISHNISESNLWMEITKEVWEELKESYHQGEIFCISESQEDIYTLQQGDISITQFFTTLNKMWQELDTFCHILLKPSTSSVHWFDCISCLCNPSLTLRIFFDVDTTRTKTCFPK